MRRAMRTAGTLAIMTILAALAAVPVMAGNFAEVTMLEGGDTPPVAGEEREMRFLLLQHGVTPVDHGSVDVVARLTGSDEEIVLPATAAGDGEWVATITFPESGTWQIGVTHNVFETSVPTTLTVAAALAPASAPVTWPVALVMLVVASLLIGMGAFISWRGRRVVLASPEALRPG